MSFSPFPADLRISPVSQVSTSSWVVVPWDHALLETLEPVGHIRLDFEITDLHLSQRPKPVALNTLKALELLAENSMRKSEHK